MKTTSYEISKQLAEAGFSKQVGFLDYYFNTDKELRHRDQENYLDGQNTEVDCFSYDLETILNALPKEIIKDNVEYTINVHQNMVICYIDSCGENGDLYGEVKQENESLADCAAKLWLKLKENNLI